MTEPSPVRPTPPPFRTTRWSLVAAAGGTGEAARTALTELAERYWYPVYAYLRRCGHAPAAAQAVAGSFFGALHARPPMLPGGPGHGRFREFLLEALNEHLARAEPTASGSIEASPPVPLDELEARVAGEVSAPGTPADVFQHSYARELLLNALLRLRREAQGAGRAAMFERLEPLLSEEPRPGQIEALAAEQGTRPLALLMALKRLRQRFRELVEFELGETVDSADALEAERLVLHRLLTSQE